MIEGGQKEITWKEFETILMRSYLVTPTRMMPELEEEKHHVCTLCGDMGHTHEEHQDKCPYCEGSHPGGDCPLTKITCFLCEGTDHLPTQCEIYPKVELAIQQQEETLKEALIDMEKFKNRKIEALQIQEEENQRSQNHGRGCQGEGTSIKA